MLADEPSSQPSRKGDEPLGRLTLGIGVTNAVDPSAGVSGLGTVSKLTDPLTDGVPLPSLGSPEAQPGRTHTIGIGTPNVRAVLLRLTH